MPTIGADLYELATRHVQLAEHRPPDPLSEPYREHMHQIHLLYREMLGTFGYENATAALEQAQSSWDLLMPPGIPSSSATKGAKKP